MTAHLRIACLVRELKRSAAPYLEGLGLGEPGRFADHAGFAGVVPGDSECPYHFEFTCCQRHPVAPTPTAQGLVVLYLPDQEESSRGRGRP